MDSLLPVQRFDLGGDSAAEAWLQYRALMSPFFEVEVDTLDGFYARAEHYLGPIVCGPSRSVRQRYKRSHRAIAASGLDQYVVQLCKSGSSQALAHRREMIVRPGDVGILDLAQSCESQDEEGEIFTLIVPRPLLDEAVGTGACLHGAVLRGDTIAGGLFAEFLTALEERLPRARQSDLPEIVEATVALLAASLRPQVRTAARAAPTVDALKALRIRRYVRQNLSTPDLTPDAVASRFRISRTQLYRYFESDGGITAYVRTLRLRQCFFCLADPNDRRSIRDIAEEHGFDCEPHFSRLFHRTFGMTPSEVRRNGFGATLPHADGTPAVHDWLRRLG